MEEKNIFYITTGEDYKLQIEGKEQFENSIFKELYLDAFKKFEDILGNYKEKSKENLIDPYNNIIAFVGDRGTGKTSAMLSFEKLIKERQENNFLNKYKLLNESLFEKNQYLFLETIDPSFFDKKSNVLEIILARMFKKVKDKVDKNNNCIDDSNFKRLLEKFKEVHKNICTLSEAQKDLEKDSLDSLLNLSSGIDLRLNLGKLVKEYLKYFETNKLIIKIDDIDLNTEYAYKMIEQVRKYLLQENIIILMAVKIQQLEEVLKKKYMLEFKELLLNKEIELEEIALKTNRYLEKLIPVERRLYLPTFDNLELKNKKLVILKKNQSIKKFEEENNEEIKGLEETVLKLIYNKTRILFLINKSYINPIIPRNLRELRNFISFLIGMKEAKEETREKIQKENREKFKKYFVQHWLTQNLSHHNQELVREIYSREVREKNKITIELLKENLTDYLNEQEETKNIINENNNSINISLGDVLFILKKLSIVKLDSENKNLIFAIKAIYNFMIYDLYKNSKSLEENYSDYEILIGGEFFKLESNYVGNLKDYKEFNFKLYRDNLEKFLKNKQNEILILERIKKYKNDDQDLIKELKKLEFLVNLAYFFNNLSTQEDQDDKVYRKLEQNYYSKEIDVSIKTGSKKFSLLAPLFLVISKEKTLKRFYSDDLDNNLYNLVTKVEKSISENNILKEKLNLNFNIFKNLELRNIFVIEELFQKVFKKPIYNKAKLEQVKEIYKKISKIKINTKKIFEKTSYERKADINYEDKLKEVINFFENLNSNLVELFNNLFILKKYKTEKINSNPRKLKSLLTIFEKNEININDEEFKKYISKYNQIKKLKKTDINEIKDYVNRNNL